MTKLRINMLSIWFVANSLLWPFYIHLSGFKLGLNIIVLLTVGTVWVFMNARFSQATFKAGLVLATYLVFSYVVAVAGPCEDKLLKLAVTGPVLVFVVLIGVEIGWAASEADWRGLQRVAPWILLVAFIGFLFEALFPANFPNGEIYRSAGKYSGIYLEPSHVAISLFPSIAILLLAEVQWKRRVGMLALLGLLAVSRSSTLLVMTICWVVYSAFVQRRFVKETVEFFVVAVVVGLFAAIIEYDSWLYPTIERFSGVVAADTIQNISSMVYLQGWQDTWANLLRTYGFGLGFNMMGCAPLPDVPAREALVTLANIELNADDGSILFAKLVSEAGGIGILFFGWILWWWMRVEKAVRKYRGSVALHMASALIFCFVVTSLLRSAGYFSGGLLLLVVAVAATIKWRRSLFQLDRAVAN